MSDAFTARLTLPSSNRTCGFPASGSRENSRHPAHVQRTSPGSQPESQARTFDSGSSRRSLNPEFRRGTQKVQAAFPPSYPDAISLRPLGSTAATPLPRYYGPVRLPISSSLGYAFPNHEPQEAGSPRFLDRSFATRCPLSPRSVRQVRISRTSLPMRASSFPADWPLPSV